MSKYLLIAPLCLLAASCSKTLVSVPMPPPEANLAQDCPPLPPIPILLADPDRLQWELDALNSYADCAARHRASIKAWLQAVQTAKN